MKKSIAMFVLLAFLIPIVPICLAENKVVEEFPQKKSAGADPNIKSGSQVNQRAMAPKAPPAKGGEQARGYWCGVVIDNWTPWKIQVYVDGEYQGIVAAWADMTAVTFSGPTRLYARTDFDDDSALTWGPKHFQCDSDEVYTWKLRE